MLEVSRFLILLVPVGAAALIGWVVVHYVRRSDPTRTSLPPNVHDTLRLEEQVASLQSEMAQMRERQDFMEKLLARPKAPDSER